MAGSMLAFALAAWACGEAGSFGQLVGWRFIQGMAGGLVIPVGQALAFNRFQGPERARVSTLVMAVALIADRKSTRLNSSHSQISYAVFCLKKKKKQIIHIEYQQSD